MYVCTYQDLNIGGVNKKMVAAECLKCDPCGPNNKRNP